MKKATKKNHKKLKLHPRDDRMMSDGTLNPDHWTLDDNYMSPRQFNIRQSNSNS